MPTDKQPDRREFLKGVGLAAGGAALGANPENLFAAPRLAPGRQVPSPYPELNDRAVGWLRFLWEKATTPDDWSRWGMPHPWWDQYSNPGVTGYPRFDLQYSAYGLMVMADQTPAWREAYTRIADELASRYVTYWGAVDWLTQIGSDPARADYPPRFMNGIPEEHRGNYDRIGWTANGIEPWGLQEDPIGSDGNLFYRAWLNLTLSIYRYVSGDDKWEQPFAVTGYRDQEFEWDHHRLAEYLERQWQDHPEGPQCENTKIWPFCNSAGTLGQYLYDKIHGTNRYDVVHGWLEYLKDNYMGVSSAGELEWFTSWYDPLIDHKANGGPAAGLGTAFLVLPQDPEFAAFVYEASANAAGWNNPQTPAAPNTTGLLIARELGDDATVARLSAAKENSAEPRFFGEHNEKFGFWLGLNDPYPRGQRSAMLMLSEIGQGGDWSWAFQAPYLDKYGAPTVEGIDFPFMGVRQAWNDASSGVLHVSTYAVTSDRREQEPTFRVTNVPDTEEVFVLIDGQPFDRFEVEGPGVIRLDSDIGEHRYQIFTGYRGSEVLDPQASRTQQMSKSAGALALASRPTSKNDRAGTSDLLAGPPPVCGCC
ncbi:MAG: twin-arginine translocation signal domain-containing protein [Gemmatimonadetes bacterium]|nr:twin-arginine translocation signal domain-containing protein [Gemmatimonadota bacterium]